MSERHERHEGEARRKPKRHWVRGIVLAALIGLVGIGAAAVVSGHYQLRPVLSGSMRPGLPVGGLVITKRVPLDDINVRDVIVFTDPDDPSKLVVHRLISLQRTGATVTAKTQGDANNAPDPWTLTLHGTTAYRAIYTVPLLGYPAVWLQNLGGRGLLLLAAGLAVIISMVQMWRNERRKRAHADRNVASDGHDELLDTPAADSEEQDATNPVAAYH